MIVMLISDAPERERKEILALARNEAAMRTDERWLWLESGTVDELSEIVKSQPQVDLFCLDLTISGTLEMAPELRRENPESYIILIADNRISPVLYLRPQIGAGSLLLKPIRRKAVAEVMGEAIHSYLGIDREDAGRMFVVENRGERTLVSFRRINYFESRDKRIYLCTDTEEYAFYETMDELAKTLGGKFLRTHRSFLVSKEKIASVFVAQGRVVLQNGTELPISRSCKETVREYLREAET